MKDKKLLRKEVYSKGEVGGVISCTFLSTLTLVHGQDNKQNPLTEVSKAITELETSIDEAVQKTDDVLKRIGTDINAQSLTEGYLTIPNGFINWSNSQSTW
jgi:hypothetical protein